MQELCRSRALTILADLNGAHSKDVAANLKGAIDIFEGLQKSKSLIGVQADVESVEESRKTVHGLSESVKGAQPVCSRASL